MKEYYLCRLWLSDYMVPMQNYVNVFGKLEWIKNGELKKQILKDLLNLFRGIIFILISASYSNKMFHLFSTPNTLKYIISFYCLSPKLKVCLWDLAYIFSGSEGECSMTFCCVSAWKLSIPETKHAWIRLICISASQQGQREPP